MLRNRHAIVMGIMMGVTKDMSKVVIIGIIIISTLAILKNNDHYDINANGNSSSANVSISTKDHNNFSY